MLKTPLKVFQEEKNIFVRFSQKTYAIFAKPRATQNNGL